MNPQFLIAKLAANATDNAWSQAYSTLNFYVVLSVKSDQKTDKTLAQSGKELLERLQREYFSLDEKSLESIKSAVDTTVASVEKTLSYSLILVTNNADTLYIVTAGPGKVAIKRDEKLGMIAQGKEETVLSFSGPLKNQDIIVLQTADFSQKIPPATLAASLDSLNVTDISENIAPHLHHDATGAEAAIVLLYSDPETVVDTAIPVEIPEEENDTSTEPVEKPADSSAEPPEQSHLSAPLFEEEEKEKQQRRSGILSSKILIASIVAKKKMIIGLAIFILFIGLVGSIFWRSQQQETAQNGAAISQAVAAAQSEYEEGEALEPLNRPLALDKFNKAQALLTETKNKYPNDDEIAQVEELLAKVDKKLTEFSSGKKVENGESLATASSLKLSEIQTVSARADTLFVTDKSGSLVILEKDGSASETYELDSSTIIDSSNANAEFAFILTGSGVSRVSLKSGDENELFELEDARQTLALFGSNIYLSNSSKKMIEKYAPSSYQPSDYLSETLPSTPISLAIDGSVYVLYDTGKIGKFTRGISESFNLTGLQGGIGKKSMLYTEEDFSNLYVLDAGNQRLLAVSKNGEVKQEYNWDIFKDAIDIAIDESNKTAYIVTPKELYTFSF